MSLVELPGLRDLPLQPPGLLALQHPAMWQPGWCRHRYPHDWLLDQELNRLLTRWLVVETVDGPRRPNPHSPFSVAVHRTVSHEQWRLPVESDLQFMTVPGGHRCLTGFGRS